MVKEIRIESQTRTVRGSSAVRRLRKQGLMPAVVNNDQGKATAIQLNAHDFEKMLHHHRSENLLIDLQIDGGSARKVLLREVQHDPLKGHTLHADFLEVSMARRMRLAIPIRLAGEPVGVSQQGGILEQVLRELTVECLPGDIVESIDVDVTALNMGQSVRVRDMKVDPKLVVITGGDIAVATVAAPRKEEEVVAPEAAAAPEAAEPEVITAKKEEGEEGEAAEEGEEKEKERPREKGKEPKEKGKEPREKGKEPKEKGKEPKEAREKKESKEK